MQKLSLAWCALHCIHTLLAVSEQSQVASNPVLDQRPASGVTTVSEMVKGFKANMHYFFLCCEDNSECFCASMYK